MHGSAGLTENDAGYMGAVGGHRTLRAILALNQGGQTFERRTCEAGMGQVHRAVEYGDAHFGGALGLGP